MKKENLQLGRSVKFNALTLARISILVAFVGLCTAAFSPPEVEASHFRFGHISWKPLTGTDIEFTITQAWRGTAFGPPPPLGVTFSPGGFDFGDGTDTGLTLTVTSLDPVNDWIVGTTTITHTYPSPGDFTAFFESCCRIGNCRERPNAHINNSDGNERLETIVNVGTGNSSPVSNLPPIVICPENGVCSFQIPATDPDRDPLTFRLSTSDEAGGFTQPGPPHAPNPASIDPNTGVYTWDTRGATLTPNPASCPNTLYSTQVMIEDGQTKVPLDFLIQLMPVTSMPPRFDSPTPDCGATLNTNIGSTLTFTVQASDPVPAQTVTLNATGLPLGATMTPSLPTTGNPVSSTFSWTPAPGQNGNYVINFTVRDDAGSQEEQCSLTIIVAGENCSNGIDDDGDLLVDCNDPDCSCNPACAPPTETSCTNRIDDDCDGLVDCFDPDCGDCLPITRILPDKGGDTGTVTTVIYGTGFVDGATVRLVRVGQPDIVGDPVGVGEDGRTITTTFDCTGKARGLWDVVVTNPDGTPGIFAEGFTIEEGVAPQVWVDIVGRDVIRLGRQQVYTILYGNRGNVDAVGVPLWIGGIPKDATWEVLFEIIPPPPIEGQEPIDWSQFPDIHIETDEEIILPLFIPSIPQGFTGVLKFTVTVPTPQDFQLRTWVNPPYFQSPLSDIVKECWIEIMAASFDAFGLLPGGGCIRSVLLTTGGTILSGASIGLKFRGLLEQVIPSGISIATSIVLTVAVDCLPGIVFPPSEALRIAFSVTSFLASGFSAVECVIATKRQSEMDKDVQTVGSIDPNEKVGSGGFGESRYISGEEPLRYAIFFENIETATAAAQEVLVTEQLDINKLDLDTFGLGPIAFGDKEVVPPPGLSEFTTDIDLRPDKNLIVRIDARLNKSTGVVTWRFTSIDPDTGGLPDDPLAGFLPPNVNPPEGDGSVMFTVMPNEGLATGTEIRNKATIVFDVNPPIETNEWLNTLDNTKPESHVLPLSATQELPEFAVEWTGADDDSQIKDWTVFVSENGGPYTPWLTNTTDTLEIFTGQPCKTYAFYSVARDNTGNQEDAPTDADATTQVECACQCPTNSPKGCISGTVRDGEGKTVILKPLKPNRGEKHRKAVTDSNGCYIFSDLKNGRYRVWVIGRCRASHQIVKIFRGAKKNDVNFECR